MSWSRIRHRATQFGRTVSGAFRPVDTAYARARLVASPHGPELLNLFLSMSRAEQHHGVEICRALERQGLQDPDLLIAALLHDVGKTVAPMHLWERVFVVLVERFAPRLASVWGDAERQGRVAEAPVPAGARRGFIVRRHHARWGAELVAQAGASPRVVEWIGSHHQAGAAAADPLLTALQVADET